MNDLPKIDNKWQFWVDRGGTFTDIIAKKPNGELESLKLLSENSKSYSDPIEKGIEIFFNKNNFWDNLFKQFKFFEDEKFSNKNLQNSFHIIDTVDQLKNILIKWQK